ncbi:Rpn family recombination-promoting nuclease/putative transposase [Bacillus tropicus]|uniref:Rpn family recombination-promoting nuclease/putative transposase n=1 Tax=Bacillus tropicus TaxID=2026188 RepID=UPI002DBF542F|nr:Rpn family recombination-promoting nuclease/putative transposase [Bacillus tropicus]MEC2921512.1 Rpn family recombination-promoting nuclease/putative transposase [Bacillus tropicus]MEC2927264.1 Rpn family recombination-promoting nuclease/putative transposase [Bacillus tropicus]MEC2953447.1 Rpn family recombination-promoting nuclease/putative transposase [Bacillus tropicus]MEC3046617.1 Rpn family recombination-promoting nuclease/putative transposase [Bacillus tropicus]MEC3075005.1 Rpn family
MFNQQLVNLRIDFAFKQLFGTNGSEDILIAFLNAMLQESLESPIASLQLEDPHLHREHANDKLSILDISATLDTGTKVNVEIQLNNNHDMMKRSLYYLGKLYTSQLQKGMPYSALRKTITINLLNFIMFLDHKEFHTTGTLWNTEQQELLSDDIEIHIVEIQKLTEQWHEEKVNPWKDPFVRWLLLLSANEDEHLTKLLEDIAMNQDPILQKAINKWERMSQDSSFRQAYDAREKVLMDEAAKFAHAETEGMKRGMEKGMEKGLEKGIEQGIEQGRKEGVQQGKIQMIKSMYDLGIPLETIAKASKLSVHDVEQILGKK